MPGPGGRARSLTFQDVCSKVAGWSPDGAEIVYASNAGQFAMRFEVIYAISPKGGEPRQLPFGLANAISYGPHGGIVLGPKITVPDFPYPKPSPVRTEAHLR